jgi:type I restriction enzyme, S subunit
VSEVIEAREPSARYLAVQSLPLVLQFDLLAAATGGTARLRELIVLLALKGKLVAQNLEDLRALDWLATLQRERQDLIETIGAGAPKTRAVVPEDEQWFDLPPSWTWVRLGDLVAASEAGWSPSCSETPRQDGQWGVLKVSAVSWGEFDPGANKELPSGLPPRPEYEVRAGDFLLSRANTAELVARSVVVRSTPPRLMLSDKIIRLILPQSVNRSFLNLCNNSAAARIYYAAKASGTSSSMKNVSREVVLGLPIPLPPIREQARIVARVDELMRLCDALEAKGRLEAEQHARLLSTLLGTLTDSTTLEELAANWQRVAEHFDLLLDRPEAVDALEQTILQLAVRGLLVPQDPKNQPADLLLQAIRADRDRLISEKTAKPSKATAPSREAEMRFALPHGWAWARLDEISQVIVDCPHSTPKFVDSGLLCLDTNSFKGGVLVPHKLRFVSRDTFDERVARLRPEPGDLVFAREGSVGESIIIPAGAVCCLGQRVMLFRLSTRVSNEFVRLAITTQDFLDALLSLHKGIGAKHVNVGDMRNAVVPVPPFAEQQRILARVAELRSHCSALRQRLTDAQTTQSHLAETLVETAIA